MLWGFIALAIVVPVVLAGRAHSRYLDRQDQMWADIIASGQADIIDEQADIIASEERVVVAHPA